MVAENYTQDVLFVEEQVKNCPKCNKTKPLSEFHRRNKNGRQSRDRKTGKLLDKRTHTSWCKRCRTEHQRIDRAQLQANGEQKKISKRLYPQVWEVEYGITVDQYERLVQVQNNLCAICELPELTKHHQGGTLRRLSVDHDHATGKVRGLLCRTCNMAIGNFKENIEIMKKAIAYMEIHKE